MSTPSKSDIVSYGPLDPLMADPTVNEIMVNGPQDVYLKRRGVISRAEVTFENNEHILRILHHILAHLGYRIDAISPIVDISLPDGSLFVAAIPPITPAGPTITILKFLQSPLHIEDLVRFGTISPEITEFARSCIVAGLNIVVSGGIGSGKVTLLNVLSSFIPNDERVITIERTLELRLQSEHLVRLVARPPNNQGKEQISIQDLITLAAHMRSDRIIFGEFYGGEALDIVQAMNTNSYGSMTTLYANTPRDCLARIEKMCLLSGRNFTVQDIREQITLAIDLIIQIQRLHDGQRKITHITEVQGMESDKIITSDVFIFEQTGIEQGKIIGRIRPTGIRPNFIERVAAAGISLPAEIFTTYQSSTKRKPHWFKRHEALNTCKASFFTNCVPQKSINDLKLNS